jgi:Na+-transporting methylmalonyl-CoA/oxaloacetate decarboxylase gamma subunit
MKKIIIFSFLVLLILSAGCSAAIDQFTAVPKIEVNKLKVVESQDTEQADEQANLDEIISSYLAQQLAFTALDGTVFEAHEIYGTEEKDGKTYVYLWSMQQEYAYENNEILRGAGSSMPLVMVLEKDSEGKYSTITHMVPRDGEHYSSSVKKLFPEKYHDKIFERVHSKELEEIIKQKAINHFFSEVDDEEASDIAENFEEINPSPAVEGKDGELLKGKGLYVGQIDNNSIEVELNTNSGEKSFEAFRFSDSSKAEFEKLNLETGDLIELTFIKNGYGQLVIMSIDKVDK